MRLELTGRHLDITPVLRRIVSGKLARLERMLHEAAISAAVVLSIEKESYRAEVTLHARGETFLHGTGKGTDFRIAMGQAVDRLVQQAETVKGKRQARTRKKPATPKQGGAGKTSVPPVESE
jgi:ribosomal subunit interface protein